MVVKEKEKDRYGRTIGMVTIGETNVNEELLKNGLAWHYIKYDKSTEWDSLESIARIKKVGLWSNPNPVPPWNYRKAKKVSP